jgi:prophage antirepressor-like protein
VQDACKCLGLASISHITDRIPKQHWKQIPWLATDGKMRNMLAVDEAGLNYLIMRSDKPEALRYKEWAFAIVLPSIRKTGAYVAPGMPPQGELASLIDTAKDLILTMKALVVNHHDMNIFELAEYYKRYMHACGLTQVELAERFEVTQGHISNTLRLLELPEKVRFMIVCGELPETHGRCLLQLHGNPALITELARAVIKKAMTIEELDAVVKQVIAPKKPCKQLKN